MSWTRRRVLKGGGALAGVSAAALLAGTARSAANIPNDAIFSEFVRTSVPDYAALDSALDRQALTLAEAA